MAVIVLSLSAMFFVAWHNVDIVANHFASEMQYCNIDFKAEDCGIFFCHDYIFLYKFSMALLIFAFVLAVLFMIAFFEVRDK